MATRPAALAGAAKKIEAVYEAPYLAHAPMEPLNCAADVRADSCEVWASTQGQSAARQEAVRITGLRPDQVKVHTEYMGGGFGRRARSDYIGEAVEISKAARRAGAGHLDARRRYAAGLPIGRHPIRASRRPGRRRLAGGIHSRVVCPPFGGVRNGIARTGIEGIVDTPYAIPNCAWWIITRPIPEFR